MAMIACSECGESLSTKAAACPHCGAPVDARAAAEANGLDFGVPCGSCGGQGWSVVVPDAREPGRWSKGIGIVATLLVLVAIVQGFSEGFGEAWGGLVFWGIVAVVAWSVHEGRGTYALYKCGSCGYLQRGDGGAPSIPVRAVR